jgi:chromosome partitioning protein
MEMTETTIAPKASGLPTRQIVITVCSPKGGAGKTTVARALLVAAANDGCSVLGVDFDPQQGLAKWAARRERTRVALPSEAFSAIPVKVSSLSDWRERIAEFHGPNLVVLDTPPSVEANLPAILGLCSAATIVIVPTAATRDDLDSVLPWMAELLEADMRASFVLNRVNRRTNTFAKSQARLMRVGPVCPVEIPSFDEIHALGDNGLTVLDVAKSKGREPMELLWSYAYREATRR